MIRTASAKKMSLVGALMAAALAPAAPATAQGQAHCGPITNNETWTRTSSPHNVTCHVQVRNSVLRIEPGALVLMHNGTNIEIQAGGSLQAIGDNTGRIRFRAIADNAPAGTWGQLRFLPDSGPSAMEFVDVNDGGRDGVPMVYVLDSVVVMGTQPTPATEAKNVRLFNAAGSPLTISANTLGPSLAGAGDFPAGRACFQLAIEETNAMVGIEVMAASEPDVRDSQTWFDFSCSGTTPRRVPYYIEDEVTIGGPDSPTLEINAGVEIRFGTNGGIRAGMDADNLGQLETNGTPAQRVRIRGQQETPGSWGSIHLTDFTFGGHSLSETRIEQGGARNEPMVRVGTDTAISGGVEFVGALSYPLEITAEAVQGFLEEIWVVRTPRFLENGVQRVLVVADETHRLNRSTSWGDVLVPYEMTGDLNVGRDGDAARFRLLPGSTLLFREGAGLAVGEGDLAAQFYAEGEPERPVVLSGVEEAPGSWAGVVVGPGTEDAGLRGTRVSFGGAADVPMVVWSAPGSITSTVLSDAPGYPLALPFDHIGVLLDDHPDSPPGDRRCSQVERCANTLERNGTDHFLVDGATVQQGGSFSWHDPGAPVEFDSDLAFVGNSVRLDLHDGLELRFRAGDGLSIGQDITHQGTLNFVDNNPERRAVLGAADASVGWAGATVMEGSRVTGSGGAFDEAATGAASLRLVGATADLTDVAFRDALGTGARAEGAGARLDLTLGSVTGNRIGIAAAEGAMVSVSRSTIAGNTEWGVLNEHRQFCIDAVRVFWGRVAGPDDPSDAPDRCMNAGNVSPGADRPSDFVDWWPYALNGGDFAPATGLGPNPKRVYLPIAVNKGNPTR